MRKTDRSMQENSAGLGQKLLSFLHKHWRLSAGALLLVAAVGAALLYFHGHRPAAVTPYPHELGQVSFAVAGDVIPHGAVRAAAAAAGDGRCRAGARSSPMWPMSSNAPTSAL
jgi:hypothetical protein